MSDGVILLVMCAGRFLWARACVSLYAPCCVRALTRRLYVRLSELIAEYRELKKQRDRHGSTSKETKSLRSRMQRRRSSMLALMQQIDAWTSIAGSQEESIATAANLDSWIQSGEVPFGGGSRLQVARCLYIAWNEYSRSLEEDKRIHVEVQRLSCYLGYMQKQVIGALSALEEGSVMTHDAFDNTSSVAAMMNACSQSSSAIATRLLLSRKLSTLNGMYKELHSHFKSVPVQP